MDNNMGNTIKGLASVFAALDILATVIAGIVCLFSNVILGVVIIAAGIFIAWIFWLFMYAYGHLVDSVDSLTENVKNIQIQLHKIKFDNGITISQPAKNTQMAGYEKIPAWKRVETEKQSQESK